MANRSHSTPSVPSEQRRQMIAEAAYFRAEQRGFGGDGIDDWLQAEAEIDRLLLRETGVRQSLLERLEQQMSEWEEHFEELRVAAHHAGAKLGKEVQEQLDMLNEKRASAHEKLTRLREHGAEAWEEWRDSAERLLSELRGAGGKLAARLKRPGKGESGSATRSK